MVNSHIIDTEKFISHCGTAKVAENCLFPKTQ